MALIRSRSPRQQPGGMALVDRAFSRGSSGGPILSLAGAGLAYFVASWDRCMKWSSDLASIGTFVEGAPAAHFCSKPAAHRDRRDLGPRPAIGHFVESREVGIENVPCWRGCEGDPCCAVTRVSIGHLVDIFLAARFLLWAGGRSPEKSTNTGDSDRSGPRPSQFPPRASRSELGSCPDGRFQPRGGGVYTVDHGVRRLYARFRGVCSAKWHSAPPFLRRSRWGGVYTVDVRATGLNSKKGGCARIFVFAGHPPLHQKCLNQKIRFD